ncbi:hypothetical protein CI238_00404 [Colletotrichum incanum]|uniref:Uncharacterized protein n=1 Tax=Colletotrichum incanum TaxID=1573173 RepID=A0A167BFW3_COLIC|nr:hypothetical protein CI238_00404 [Colletotrichum incanum]
MKNNSHLSRLQLRSQTTYCTLQHSLHIQNGLSGCRYSLTRHHGRCAGCCRPASLQAQALLCMQGREGQARRVHALLQRRRPVQRLPVHDRPVPGLHEGVRFHGVDDG